MPIAAPAPRLPAPSRPPSEAARLLRLMASLGLACAAVAFWNSDRLAPRFEMLAEPERGWALGALDLLGGPPIRARLHAIQLAISEDGPPAASAPALAKPAPCQDAKPQGGPALAAAPARAEAGAAAAMAPPIQEPKAEGTGQGAHGAAADASELPPSIYFAGDSLANGYAAGGAAALAQAKSKSRAVDAGKISTGLVAKSYYDWGAKARELCAKSPGAVVFSFGANDPMDMREGKSFLRFGSPEWMQAYGQRALDVVQAAHGCGAKAVWLMLPPMREEAMERKAATIRQAQAGACAASDACVKPFQGLGSLEERFAERGQVGGRSKLLRAQDGVHMAPEGYFLVAKQALDSLGLGSAAAPKTGAALDPRAQERADPAKDQPAA